MRGIEALIVFTVTSFHLSIVPWSKGPDLFVADAMLEQTFLKQCEVIIRGRIEAFCKLQSVISLNTFDRHRERL
jgi:hypothetical protein